MCSCLGLRFCCTVCASHGTFEHSIDTLLVCKTLSLLSSLLSLLPILPSSPLLSVFCSSFSCTLPYMTTSYRNPSLSLSFSIWMLKTSESLPAQTSNLSSEWIYLCGFPWTSSLHLSRMNSTTLANLPPTHGSVSGYYLVRLSQILGAFTTCGFCILITCSLFLLFLMPYF